MSDYLKPNRGARENAAMTFAGYGIIFLGWTFGAALFITVAMSALNFHDMDSPWKNFLVSFSQFIPILAAVIGVTILLGRKPLTLITSESKFSFSKLGLGVISWGGLLILGATIGWAIDPSSLKFTFDPASFFPALFVLIVLLPIQVGAEELFFRGFIPQSLTRTNLSSASIVLISTLLFTLPHLLNPEAKSQPIWAVIAYSSMGFGWLVAARWSGGLEVAIGAHIINNFFGLAIVGYEDSVVAPSSIWVGPAANMQTTAIALWLTVGIWLLLVKRFGNATTN